VQGAVRQKAAIQAAGTDSTKGAIAPFVFIGAIFAAAGSLVASPSLWLGALAGILAGVACQSDRSAPGRTPLALAVGTYAAWAVANDFFNTAYTPAGVFHPLLLAAGFVLARGCDDGERDQLFAVFVAVAGALALWGLLQTANGAGRAHAHFETPSTLATVLNLALAPVAIAIALGNRRRVVPVGAALLAAGLMATLSRGGCIALAAGVALAWFFSRASSSLAASRRAFGVLGAAVALAIIALGYTGVAATSSATLASRAELYRLAWSAAREHPWVGIGYLGFRDLLESRRAEVPSYGVANVTYFAHNDYLQTFLELGAPGAALLIAIVVLPFVLLRTRKQDGLLPRAVPCALAALAAMAVHALGDFPFYVPLCLLAFGFALGVVDRALAGASIDRRRQAPTARLTALATAALLAYLVLPPAAAEAAAAYGDRHFRYGQGESAAYGFELARRLQPRDWRYHWFAGQFWLAQAKQGNPAAAQLADRAFAAAMQANRAEPQPIFGRLAIQLGFARLLERPQTAETLRGWAERALALAPLNPAVRRDHAAALAQLAGAR
jgi:O-antigen ligase